jgi:hypothetical protein
MNWIKIEFWTIWIKTAVNILTQSITLAKLIRNGNYKAFVKITAMFLLSNVVEVLGQIAFIEYSKNI